MILRGAGRLASRLLRSVTRVEPRSREQALTVVNIRDWREIKNTRSVVSPTLVSLGVYDIDTAKAFVSRLNPGERELIYDIIRRRKAASAEPKPVAAAEVHHEDLVSLWWMNFLPFFSYGFIDNAMMIVVGESVDATIGHYIGISIMAAAAVGNIVSNLMDYATVAYVQHFLVQHVNIQMPLLTQAQWKNKTVKTVVTSSRIFGLLSGLIMGMFPLLFYDSPERPHPPKAVVEEVIESENQNAELERWEDSTDKAYFDKIEGAAKTLNAKAFDDYRTFCEDWQRLTSTPTDGVGGFEELDND